MVICYSDELTLKKMRGTLMLDALIKVGFPMPAAMQWDDIIPHDIQQIQEEIDGSFVNFDGSKGKKSGIQQNHQNSSFGFFTIKTIS
ncbi:hypothetical protein L1987_04096 [Smallanthus sonchifolius]|uniref:Uncharacterized protein n=1 Tax=Smallanthus sonchifolius TaxID=185202 RepID=A0ACB9KCH2_9ASTR|nr:hypothetical protein L1987_04096 [Smallanthus sonchifolius]